MTQARVWEALLSCYVGNPGYDIDVFGYIAFLHRTHLVYLAI